MLQAIARSSPTITLLELDMLAVQFGHVSVDCEDGLNLPVPCGTLIFRTTRSGFQLPEPCFQAILNCAFGDKGTRTPDIQLAKLAL